MIAEGLSRLEAAFRSLYVPVHESRKQGFGEAYLIFFLLGVGFLLPWNAFITAIDYFSFLYPNAHVGALFSVAYMLTCLTSLLLLLRCVTVLINADEIDLGCLVHASDLVHCMYLKLMFLVVRNTLHSMCLVMNQAFLRCPEKWHSMIRTTTSYFRPNVALLLAVLLVMWQVRQPHLISHPHHPGLLCLRLPHALHASS